MTHTIESLMAQHDDSVSFAYRGDMQEHRNARAALSTALTEVLAERDALLKAMKKITMTEYHIDRPPIESLTEQMRNIAIAAMKGQTHD